VGLLQIYGNWLSIPAEISAICVLFQFWTDLNSSVWIILFIFLTFVVGMSLIRVYGKTISTTNPLTRRATQLTTTPHEQAR
jgi:amino acid transporter